MKQELKQYLSALEWRYATKVFDPKAKIDIETLQGLWEALRLTASSFGLQLWKFIVVEDPALRQQLFEKSFGQGQVKDASQYIVFCAPRHFESTMIDHHIENTASTRGMKPEDLAGFSSYLHGWFSNPSWPVDPWIASQLYIALGNLLSACAIAKVDACPMEGFSHEAYDEILGLEAQNLRSVAACAIGYRSSEDKYATLAKVRYPLSEVLITR